MSAKLTPTQLRVLKNAAAGRHLDDGRAFTQSAAAGWSCSITSCRRKGWLDRDGTLTDAGRAALEQEGAP